MDDSGLMFLNLYFLYDPLFMDHNFSDFWNYDGGGPPIEREHAIRIRAYLNRSYTQDSKRPGRLEGLPPDFNPIISMTLSTSCCASFIRANPALPITPRDYYLSKLFQFTYDALIERFAIDLSNSDLRMHLHEQFERITDEALTPDGLVRWQDVWWAFYADTLSNSLTDVIRLLEDHITGALESTTSRRQHGPPPATGDHGAVNRVIQQIVASGRDWADEIHTVCAELDRRKVPCYLGRERKSQTTWQAKLRLRGKESVKKDIKYRLNQFAKVSSVTA
jgi:hypothetical protein